MVAIAFLVLPPRGGRAVDCVAWSWEQCLEVLTGGTLPEQQAIQYTLDAASHLLHAAERSGHPRVIMSTDLGIAHETYDGIGSTQFRDAGLPEDVVRLLDRDPTGRWRMGIMAEMPAYQDRETRGTRELRIAQAQEAFAASRRAEAEWRWILREAFIHVLLQQALLEEQAAIRASRRRILDAVEANYQAGTAQLGQAAVSRSALAEIDTEIHQTERSLALHLDTLNFMLGLEPGSIQAVTGPLGCAPPPVDAAEMIAARRDRIPEYEMAVAREKQSESRVYMLSDPLPHKLDLLAQAGTIRDRYRRDNVDWFVGIRLTVPLYDGGQSWHKASAVRSESLKAEAESRIAWRELEVRLQRALLEYQHAAERQTAQTDILAASALRAAVAEQEYKAGITLLPAWEAAETDYALKRLRRLQVYREAAVAQAAWERILGQTIQTGSHRTGETL